MKKILLTLLVLVLAIQLQAQMDVGQLTFTAVVDDSYVMLDSIKVMNRTQSGDTLLIYPDTVLILDAIVGIKGNQSKDHNALSISQNYPNPFMEQTSFKVFLPERDYLQLMVHNLLGQKITSYSADLEVGEYSFSLFPGKDNYYVVTALSSFGSHSIKVNVLLSGSSGSCRIEYEGCASIGVKSASMVDPTDFVFELGDELLYIGYANFFSGALESGILDAPDQNQTYTFQFATNIPCPGTPIVEYEGQVYNTIQIFSQCWLKENLNVGTMIQGTEEMTDNGILEKYCYNNEPDSCAKYGGLYQWNEMMQYTTQQDAQGICPQGWHLPTDEEWKVLEGAVDNQYGIGDTTWDISGIRGYDVGMNLKTTSGWNNNGNGTDLYGFSALPGGKRESDGSSTYMGVYGIIWASTEDSYLYSRFRSFACLGPELARGIWSKIYGHSVRCLQD